MEKVIEIRKPTKTKKTDFNLISGGVAVGIILLIIGVATVTKKVADWGAEHQIVKQNIVKQTLKFQLPYRIEKIEAPQPVKEIVVVGTPYEELSTTEQKIIQVWGDYKTSMIAIAVFKCESGHLADAVSETGDLGVAQIHWKTWKDEVKEKFGYTAIDMFDVDKNLEVAYWIWDRGDGIEGNGLGTWDAWSCFNNLGYLDNLQ